MPSPAWRREAHQEEVLSDLPKYKTGPKLSHWNYFNGNTGEMSETGWSIRSMGSPELIL